MKVLIPMVDLPNNNENSKPEIEVGKPIVSAPKNSLLNIGNSLADNMPEIQEHVITSSTPIENEPQNFGMKSPMTNSGEIFDPAIHAVDKDGNPKKTLSGKFAKKRGRKTGGKSAPLKTPQKAPQVSQEVMNARMTGVTAANTLITVCVAMGGEEFKPIYDEKLGVNEKEQLEGAFSNYFEAKGIDDIPPGIALTLAIGFYITPRLTLPKTQNRIANAKTSFKQKFIAWKDRRTEKRKLRRREKDGKGEVK